MANEIETHEEVCAEMRSFGNIPPPMFAWRDLAERAEAAHNHELAAKDAEIERLNRMKADYLNMQKNMKNLRAEITLKQDQICNNNQVFNAAIAKRDALIKEFVDEASRHRYCGEKWDCGGVCRSGMNDCTYSSFRFLIAKAREVVK